MRFFLIIIIYVNLNFSLSFAQEGNVGIGTANPHLSAGVEVDFENRGFLPPRMTTSERDAIILPATGLLIYNTTTNCLNFFSGYNWFEECGSGIIPPAYPPDYIHCDPNNPTAIAEILNPVTGRIWMDRNLGASQVATSSTDAAAYGDLYQWGRFADGHQCRNSGITDALSNADNPGHSLYIIVNLPPNDWRSPQNNALWQIPVNTNNPCPVGYRLPTIQEFNDEIATWSDNGQNGAFNSVLKLPLAGGRNTANGNLHETNNVGFYWTNDGETPESHLLFFYQNTLQISPFNRGFGASVRCIKH